MESACPEGPGEARIVRLDPASQRPMSRHPTEPRRIQERIQYETPEKNETAPAHGSYAVAPWSRVARFQVGQWSLKSDLDIACNPIACKRNIDRPGSFLRFSVRKLGRSRCGSRESARSWIARDPGQGWRQTQREGQGHREVGYRFWNRSTSSLVSAWSQGPSVRAQRSLRNASQESASYRSVSVTRVLFAAERSGPRRRRTDSQYRAARRREASREARQAAPGH